MELDYVNLLLVLVAAWACGTVALKLGYPSVLGELIGGIIFGPTLLGWMDTSDSLKILAEVGVLLLMLYIGMEIDPAELGRASWAGVLAAVGGFVVPFAACFAAVRFFDGTTMAATVVGLAAAGTSLAMKSRILVDLKLLDTRVAHAMMAAALVTDTVLLIVFAGALGILDTGGFSIGTLALVAGKAVLFFVVTAAIGLYVFPWVGKRLSTAGMTGRTFNFSLVLIVAVGFGEMAHLAGLHAIVGSFIAGIFLRDNVLGRTMSRDLMKAVHEISIGFLAPIFFVTAGFAVSLDTFRSGLLPLVTIVGVAIVGKIIGTMLLYSFSGNGWREGLAVATGMNGRGAVEIIIGGIALEKGIITAELFSVIVVMAIFTTLTVPLALKWSTDWLRHRGELVRSDQERRGIVILGAGPTARLLAKLLSDHQPVAVIDNNQDRCDTAQAMGLKAIVGNALQEQVLSDAGANKAQRLITLTPNPEVNALVAQVARSVFYIPEIHALRRRRSKKSTQSKKVSATFTHLQATTLFGGAADVAMWDRLLDSEQAREEIIQVSAPIEPERFFDQIQGNTGSTQMLPLVIERNDERWPFHSADRLQAGDRVIVLATDVAPSPVQDFISEAEPPKRLESPPMPEAHQPLMPLGRGGGVVEAALGLLVGGIAFDVVAQAVGERDAAQEQAGGNRGPEAEGKRHEAKDARPAPIGRIAGTIRFGS